MFCDGRPDSARTDIKSALSYLKSVLPAPDMSGPCEEGYWCSTGSSHSRQNAARPGYYTKIGLVTAGVGACAESDCLAGTYQFLNA